MLFFIGRQGVGGSTTSGIDTGGEDDAGGERMMRVCVLGGGIIGLTTAWALVEAGLEVTLIERNAAPAREASFGNGAQLSYRYVVPLASPETLAKLPATLLSSDAPLRIRPSLDPDFIRWGLKFLRHCTQSHVQRTTLSLLTLSALSRVELEAVAAAESLEFDLKTAGKLVVYRSSASFEAARRGAERQIAATPGIQSIESVQSCLERLGPLRIPEQALAGGIYTPSEQVGDCYAFALALAGKLVALASVDLRWGCNAQGFVVEAGRMRGVKTPDGVIEADVFVLANGAEASRLARGLGLRLPVLPMKGYSITVPGGANLACSVTDYDKKLVFAPLAQGVRIAGMADLVGYDSRIDPARMDKLIALSRAALDWPEGADVQPWTGLRPATPDGHPIISWSPLPNLFLNIGHGALGWTLACGSARLAREMILRQSASIDPSPFALLR